MTKKKEKPDDRRIVEHFHRLLPGMSEETPVSIKENN